MNADEMICYAKIFSDCLDMVNENEKKNPKHYPDTFKGVDEKMLHEFGIWYQTLQAPSKDKAMKEIEKLRTLKAIMIIAMIGIYKHKYDQNCDD